MFRYSISKGDNLVTFREEMENLERYFTIQQYRFPNRFTLEKIFPDSEEIMNCRIPKLTLQPLIENAVYHGLEKKLGKGTITVRAFTVGKRLTIRVYDDGEGIAPGAAGRAAESDRDGNLLCLYGQTQQGQRRRADQH